MFRWGKSGKSPAPAGSGGGTGEVKVQKVDRIEVHNLVTRPPVYGAPRPPRRGGGAAEGDDINRKAEEFIKQRKTWFHNQTVAVGPAPPRPPPPRVVS
ncbi:hypothetical protein ACP70R_040921 [Stipagrostis hirtigluma subsp. patula]